MDEPVSPADRQRAADSLRGVLAAVDEGDVTATAAERAVIAGAVATLDALDEQG